MESKTSVTLLARLRQGPADQAAWAQFTERYGRKVYAWCRQWGLQEADAEDVTQTVLLKLVEKMQAFVADGDVLEVLHTVEAREDLVRRLDDEFDRELLDEAMARVRVRVTPRTWEAFERTALRGQSGAEAAKGLGMKVATVFVARSKVQKMLQEEMQKLDEPGVERKRGQENGGKTGTFNIIRES